jgi:osmotically-inducible protein OsmY
MTEPQMLSTARPDVDIHADVNDVILRYPPLAADHHQIRVLVTDGVVSVAGHVKSQPSRRYLLDAIPKLPGVKIVNGAGLHDEDTLRREIGKLVPPGVQVNVRYGTVILTGSVPEGTTADDLFALLTNIPGVEKIITKV